MIRRPLISFCLLLAFGCTSTASPPATKGPAGGKSDSLGGREVGKADLSQWLEPSRECVGLFDAYVAARYPHHFYDQNQSTSTALFRATLDAEAVLEAGEELYDEQECKKVIANYLPTGETFEINYLNDADFEVETFLFQVGLQTDDHRVTEASLADFAASILERPEAYYYVAASPTLLNAYGELTKDIADAQVAEISLFEGVEQVDTIAGMVAVPRNGAPETIDFLFHELEIEGEKWTMVSTKPGSNSYIQDTVRPGLKARGIESK